MRKTSILALPFAALLTGLPAQDPLAQNPAARAPYSLPPTPDANKTSAAVESPALRDANASRALGSSMPSRVHFDRPRADSPLWALGTAWKASFDGHGTTVIPFFGSDAPQNFPLRMDLTRATVGGEPLPLVAGEPVTRGASVRTPRGGLTEVIDTHLDHLEQSFVFETLPNRGAIAVDVRMDTELQVQPIENGLRFGNEFGHIDYTKAIAVDGKGQRLPLDIVWTGSGVHMEIPASFVEQAQLPIVLDPVLNYWYGLASGIAALQHDSDVASIQSTSLGGRTLIIFQRQWSSVDQDCFGVMFDNNLGLVQTDFSIDFTSEDWLEVAVAGNNYAQNFLVTAEIRSGALWFIGGRMITAAAAVGSVFDIERDGVVGLPGNSFAPDVGSDPYFGVGRYCVVFMKSPSLLGAANTIYFKHVTTNGGLVSANPVLVDTWAAGVKAPAIGKSCGQSNGLPAQWLVTWQRTWATAPFDQEIHGRFVSWNGSLVGTNFGTATTVGEETAPSPSSPIDSNGTRFWPMVYESATTLGQPRDITGKLIRSDGVTQASFTLSNLPGGDEKDPEIDSDGTRFVACYSVGTVGSPQRVEAVTTAYLQATNTFRVEELSNLATSPVDNYASCNICAAFSGGSTMTPRYYISFTEQATNTFRLEAFGGWTGNATLFTVRPSQCGNLPITPSGSPALGQTVTITVGGSGFRGTLFGFPAYVPFNAGCSCWFGVDPSITYPNPMVWTVPVDPVYVGLPLAVQGWSFSGSQCLGTVDLSDTVDFTIR